MSEEYRVQLDVFSGPLDLLLYLIRRDEVDIMDIPIARVAEQYLEHARLLEHLDPDAAGDFLVMAATLVELKSRTLLPTPPLEGLDDSDDPRAPLVRQLLEYKRFKDAALKLGSAADERAKRYIRRPADLPRELEGLEFEEAQVWDLLAAFGKVMSSIGRGPSRHEVRYDDVPVELHAAEILAILEREGPMPFDALFDGAPDRMEIVGRFLALLELIRARRVRAEQDVLFGVIYLFLLDEVEEPETEAEAEADVSDSTPPVREAAPETTETSRAAATDDAQPPPEPDVELPHEQAK